MKRLALIGTGKQRAWPGQAGIASTARAGRGRRRGAGRTLIDASTSTAFDLARYPDGYTDQLRRRTGSLRRRRCDADRAGQAFVSDTDLRSNYHHVKFLPLSTHLIAAFSARIARTYQGGFGDALDSRQTRKTIVR